MLIVYAGIEQGLSVPEWTIRAAVKCPIVFLDASHQGQTAEGGFIELPDIEATVPEKPRDAVIGLCGPVRLRISGIRERCCQYHVAAGVVISKDQMRRMRQVERPSYSQLRHVRIRSEKVARGIGCGALIKELQRIVARRQNLYIGSASKQTVAVAELVDRISSVLEVEVGI